MSAAAHIIDADLLGNTRQGVPIEVLRQCHAAVAAYALTERAALPIFERLDRELRAAEARISPDPVAAARALLAVQSAIA